MTNGQGLSPAAASMILGGLVARSVGLAAGIGLGILLGAAVLRGLA